MKIDEAIADFKNWNDMGFSKAETPSSEHIVMAIKALEKQIQQKPIKVEERSTQFQYDYWLRCPTCGEEINHGYVKGDASEDDMQKYTASYMAIKALEDEGLLEKEVKLTRDRLDAIWNWLESPCPYKKTSYSQLRKMMGYEYARQKVFEILITPEVE